jgi:hypothetical protein
MTRVEIKKPIMTTQCACNGRNAKHQIIIKGIYSASQAKINLCDECFKELKEKIALS